MTDTKILGGRPVRGDAYTYSYRKPVEQYSEERFVEMIDAVFAANERATALGWVQYTPSFNDGDPCVFHTSSERIVTLDEVPDRIEYDSVYFSSDEDEVYSDDPRVTTVADLRAPGRYETRDGVWDYYLDDPDAPIDPLYTASEAFYDALDGGHFDHVVQKHFGDPAAVIVTRDEFRIEEFETPY